MALPTALMPLPNPLYNTAHVDSCVCQCPGYMVKPDLKPDVETLLTTLHIDLPVVVLELLNALIEDAFSMAKQIYASCTVLTCSGKLLLSKHIWQGLASKHV